MTSPTPESIGHTNRTQTVKSNVFIRFYFTHILMSRPLDRRRDIPARSCDRAKDLCVFGLCIRKVDIREIDG